MAIKVDKTKDLWRVSWRVSEGEKDIYYERFFVRQGNAIKFASKVEKGKRKSILKRLFSK
jgi:hypothetical protein